MLSATVYKHTLRFKQPAGTSRGVLKTKETWYLVLRDNGTFGIGECAMFRGLSADDTPDFESRLQWVCDHIAEGESSLYEKLSDYPSIRFGLEMAFKSLGSEDPFELFPSEFTFGNTPIDINGLIWMGTKSEMRDQIREKLNAGFDCLKLKIGAIEFDSELDLLKYIRSEFSAAEIELRVDANGAFSPEAALEKLKQLSDFDLHSIEQPIKQGQTEDMARLCELSPLDIALDEELIGVSSFEAKTTLLETIQPQYVILKPTLIGGYRASDLWIQLAEKLEIGWWITSALESNVGLNAISQYTFTKNSKLPQGLGTGSLFTNNVNSPLEVSNGKLHYRIENGWDLSGLNIKISN